MADNSFLIERRVDGMTVRVTAVYEETRDLWLMESHVGETPTPCETRLTWDVWREAADMVGTALLSLGGKRPRQTYSSLYRPRYSAQSQEGEGG